MCSKSACKNTCAVRARHNTFFISHACKPACARKIDDIKPAMQSSRVRTRHVHDARVHVRNSHAKFGLCMHANCKPMTVDKLYKHVHILRCNPLVIQDVNPAKEYIIVKLKRLEGVSFTDYHQQFSDKFQCILYREVLYAGFEPFVPPFPLDKSDYTTKY